MIELQAKQEQPQQACFFLDYSVCYNSLRRTGRMYVRPKMTFEDFKKKLLTRMGLAKDNSDQVCLKITTHIGSSNTPYKVTVTNQKDLLFITEREREVFDRVHFSVTSDNELTRKETTRKANKIQFDSDGSVDSIDQQLNPIIPCYTPYRGKQNVKCEFCQKTRSETELIKQLGPYYGPFKQHSHFHLLCAIWSPSIYLNDKDELVNIMYEINRCRRAFCTYCGLKGAGLGCSSENKKCKVTFHYKCAKDAGCDMDWVHYDMRCVQCIQCIQQNVKLEQFRVDIL